MNTTTTKPVVKKTITIGKNVKKVTVSNYKTVVIDPHKSMKSEMKSIGGARAILLTFASTLTAKHLKILRASKSPENYKILQSKFPASKYGTWSAFALRQKLFTNEEHFLNEMKF